MRNWAAASVSRTIPVRLPRCSLVLATRPPYSDLLVAIR